MVHMYLFNLQSVFEDLLPFNNENQHNFLNIVNQNRKCSQPIQQGVLWPMINQIVYKTRAKLVAKATRGLKIKIAGFKQKYNLVNNGIYNIYMIL